MKYKSLFGKRCNVKKYKDFGVYDFSDYAEEITGDALFEINGGAEVENSHEGVAGANVGDTITRKDGTVVTLKQADIDYAQKQLGDTGNASGGNGNLESGGNSSTSNNNTCNLNADSAPAYSASNYDAYANYMSMQGRAKDEGDPNKYKDYNVLGSGKKSVFAKELNSETNDSLNSGEKKEIVYFIYNYKPKFKKNLSYQWMEENTITDDVFFLKRKGKEVIVYDGLFDRKGGTKENIIQALENSSTKAVIFSGHGYDGGGIITYDGKFFRPYDIDKNKISPNLELIIFEDCYQGGSEKGNTDNIEKWGAAFGSNVNIVGWQGTTNVFETRSFNGLGLFDRQDKNLREYLKDLIK